MRHHARIRSGSRQWASKTLGELEAAGKIKRNRSWITLTDRIDENV